MKSRRGVKAAVTAMSPRTQRPRAWARRVCASHSSSRRVSMRWCEGRRSARNVAWTQRYVFALASLLGNTDTDCLVIALHALWKILLVEGTASFRISLEREKKNCWRCFASWWDVGMSCFFFFYISFLAPKPGPLSMYTGNAIQTSNVEMLHSWVRAFGISAILLIETMMCGERKFM